MYAGKDGNVYKNTGDGWQKYDNGSWSTVNTPENKQQAQQKPSNRSSVPATESQQPGQRTTSPAATIFNSATFHNNHTTTAAEHQSDTLVDHRVYSELQFGNAEPPEGIRTG